MKVHGDLLVVIGGDGDEKLKMESTEQFSQFDIILHKRSILFHGLRSTVLSNTIDDWLVEAEKDIT